MNFDVFFKNIQNSTHGSADSERFFTLSQPCTVYTPQDLNQDLVQKNSEKALKLSELSEFQIENLQVKQERFSECYPESLLRRPFRCPFVFHMSPRFHDQGSRQISSKKYEYWEEAFQTAEITLSGVNSTEIVNTIISESALFKCPISNDNLDFSQWKKMYLDNLFSAGIITEEDILDWESMYAEKLWLQYKSQGFGYEGFAFSHYIYQMNFSSLPQNSDIFALEKRLTASTTEIDSEEKIKLWKGLGWQHYLLGNDSQVIAALQNLFVLKEPLKIFSEYKGLSHLEVLALASAYLNENCVPELLSLLTQYYLDASVKYDSRTYYEPRDLFTKLMELYKSEFADTSKEPEGKYVMQNILGLLLVILEKFELAFDCFSDSLELHSTFTGTELEPKYILLNRIGCTLQQLGNREEARRFFTISAKDSYQKAIFNLENL